MDQAAPIQEPAPEVKKTGLSKLLKTLGFGFLMAAFLSFGICGLASVFVCSIKSGCGASGIYSLIVIFIPSFVITYAGSVFLLLKIQNPKSILNRYDITRQEINS
jgi:hypothetical protein